MARYRYALQVSINAVACDIQVNDVPVVRSYSPDRTDFVLPVSDFIVAGRNRVTIRSLVDLSEVGGSATRASATLLVTPYESPQIDAEYRPVLNVTTRAMPDADTTEEGQTTPLGPVSPQMSRYENEIFLLHTERMIDLNAEVPGWAWQGSPPVEDAEAVRDSLIAWYRQFHELLAVGETGAIRDFMGEKVYELSVAHAMSQEVTEAELGLTATMREESQRLEMPEWDGLQVELAAGGKLARLYHPADGTVISFVHEELGLFTGFDFWLRRDGSGWRIAR